MTNILSSPRSRANLWSRIESIGTPVFGRKIQALTTALTDITSVIGAGTTTAAQRTLRQAIFVDKLGWGTTPQSTSSGTQVLEFDVTDGTATSSNALKILCPADAAFGTTEQPFYNDVINFGGRFAIPAGFKLQSLVSNATMDGSAWVTGQAVGEESANRVGLDNPVWETVTATANGTTTTITFTTTRTVIANEFAGRILWDPVATAGSGNTPQARIVSNTGAVLGTDATFTITIDVAMAGGGSHVMRICNENAFIVGMTTTGTTSHMLYAPMAYNATTGQPGLAFQIQGWCLTAIPQTANTTENVQLRFTDGTTNRIIQRWFTRNGSGAAENSHDYIKSIVHNCDITGPQGFGVDIITSNASLDGRVSMIVWGKYIKADQTRSWQPHGIPAQATVAATGPLQPTFRPNLPATVNTGTATTSVTFAAIASLPTNYYKGANIVFLTGANAGLSRTITANNTTTITFSPAVTALVNGDTFAVTGFGGDKFWFNVEGFNGAGSGISLMVPEVGNATVSTAINDCDIIVDGFVASGLGGAAGQAAGFCNSSSSDLVTPVLITGSARLAKVTHDDLGIRVFPRTGDGGGASNQGILCAFAANYGTSNLSMLIWGRRVPAHRKGSLTPTSPNANVAPRVMGS